MRVLEDKENERERVEGKQNYCVWGKMKIQWGF